MASKNNAAKAAKKQAAATAKADKKAAATAKVAADKATQTATYGTGSSLTGMDTASQVGLQQKLNREQQTFTDDQNARNQTNAYGDTTTTERNPATGRLETKVTMNAADKAFQDTANAGRNQAQADFNAQGQYKGQDPNANFSWNKQAPQYDTQGWKGVANETRALWDSQNNPGMQDAQDAQRNQQARSGNKGSKAGYSSALALNDSQGRMRNEATMQADLQGRDSYNQQFGQQLAGQQQDYTQKQGVWDSNAANWKQNEDANRYNYDAVGNRLTNMTNVAQQGNRRPEFEEYAASTGYAPSNVTNANIAYREGVANKANAKALRKQQDKASRNSKIALGAENAGAIWDTGKDIYNTGKKAYNEW